MSEDFWRKEAIYWRNMYIKQLSNNEKLDMHQPESHQGWAHPESGVYQPSLQYTEEEMDAMCDAAADQEERDRCREYNLREAEYYTKRVMLDAKSRREDDLIGLD